MFAEVIQPRKRKIYAFVVVYVKRIKKKEKKKNRMLNVVG